MPGPAFKPDFAVAVARREAGRAVIEVRGELDSGTCDELLATVKSVIGEGASELTLDLRQMTFIDSAGTRALIILERLAAEHHVSLTVTPPPEEVTELLRTAGLVERVELAPEALSAAAPGGFIERTELELPRDPHSPARARAEVRECVPGLDQSELANVVLLTSELLTNAVVHPRGVGNTPVMLRVMVYEDRIRVEVEDSGEGFERVVPTLPEGERGRGLFLVDRFSNRWGSGRVQTDAGRRFQVWFEVGWHEAQAEAATG